MSRHTQSVWWGAGAACRAEHVEPVDPNVPIGAARRALADGLLTYRCGSLEGVQISWSSHRASNAAAARSSAASSG